MNFIVTTCMCMCIVGGKDHESAESYFKNIEEQTGTLILWPSKLKIGAKSKKGTRSCNTVEHVQILTTK